MKKLRRFQAVLMTAVLALGATAIAMADHGNNNNGQEVRLRTKLSGGAIQGKAPSGEADFRMDNKGRTRFNVEVENVNLPAGTVLDVTVGASSTVVGHITLNAFGSGELELNSQDGDTVPAVNKGDTVTVLNGTAAILSGTF